MSEYKNGEITLYHGSIHLFDEIDTDKGKPLKDFGRGFYTTRDVNHAEKLARRNRRFEQERLANLGLPDTVDMWLYSYAFDMRAMDTLNVKIFDEPDFEWARFIIRNRREEDYIHGFDMVIGPTADDNTRLSIRTVMNASDGKPLTDKALTALLALIEPDVLPTQYFFGTKSATRLLRPTERRKII
jgi:hypothetical protein